MINTYTEILEQIIEEMKAAVRKGNAGVIDSEYRQWLDFLKQIHPKSALLKDESPTDLHAPAKLKQYTDVREVMQLAEIHEHPTWYIQPNFIESNIMLSYEEGVLQHAHSMNGNGFEEMEIALINIPHNVNQFNGKIFGTLSHEQTYIAYDVDTDIGFVQKMEFLKNAGFVVPDYVLFPTNKLITVSSSKLELSLINFISTAQTAWAKVDGVVIVSDTPLWSGGGGVNTKRIVFKPQRSPAYVTNTT